MRCSYKNALVLGSAALAVATVFASNMPSAGGHEELETRASHIFSYDREHLSRLPAHKIRALSVALAFHDDRGARVLIEQLERSI